MRWLRDTDFPIRDADGRVRSIGGIGQDITERKRAQTALKESEDKYRTLFNSMDEAYAVVEVLSDVAGRWSDFLFLEVNPAFVEHTGMEYPVGQTATQLLGKPNPAWAEIYGRVAETGESVRTEEAEPILGRIFDLNIFRVGGPGSRRVAVLFTDITERKRGEVALKESEARLRAIADLVPDLLWRNDPAGGVTWFNRRWREYTGQSTEEALGDGWTEMLHPDDRKASLRRFQAAIDAGEPIRLEHRIRSVEGAYHWFLVQARPVRDEHSRITQWFGAATDVHEERLALQAAEAASQAKGQFLAVMSHELRTPLTGVIGFADLMETEILGPMTPKQQEALSRIKASSWHLVSIIDEILTLSRVEAGKEQVRYEAANVAAITREVVGILEPHAERQGLALRVEGAAAPLPVWTDPGKVRQVLINLVGNAVKYTPQGEIDVRLDDADPEWLRVHVRDTGPGIAPEDQERIFEAFTQVDGSHTRSGSGTGLGLAICRRLARLLGGDVTLRSVPGEGSTFTFRLPRQRKEV